MSRESSHPSSLKHVSTSVEFYYREGKKTFPPFVSKRKQSFDPSFEDGLIVDDKTKKKKKQFNRGGNAILSLIVDSRDIRISRRGSATWWLLYKRW